VLKGQPHTKASIARMRASSLRNTRAKETIAKICACGGKLKVDGSPRRRGPNIANFPLIVKCLEESFDRVGGVRYLVNIAKRHPTLYCALLARCIPQHTSLDANMHVHMDPVQLHQDLQQMRAPNPVDRFAQQHLS